MTDKKKKVTIAEATKMVVEAIREAGILGLRGTADQGASFNGQGGTWDWERCWGVSVVLSVYFELTGTEGKVNPVVQIATSATHRTVPQMLAMLTLADEVTRLAALIESRLNTMLPIYVGEECS